MLNMLPAMDGTPPPSSITLRDYQETCVQRVLDAYQRKPHGGSALVLLPTGGGKTIVFAEIARRLGLLTLVVAHREELLTQAAAKFRMIDPSATIGQVGAGRHEWGARVTVASVQTISRPEHLKALQRFGFQLVIVDECHHASANGYRTVLEALPDAFVVGVTATPTRLDRQDISALFGPPVFSASIVEMVEKGHLCDLRAIAVRTETSLDELHTQAGDFKQDELEELIDTPERNGRVVRAFWEHARGRPTLCFAVTVKHAQHMADAFCEAEVRAAMVCGETPPEVRHAILHAYERGALEVVCNVGVLTEGYDFPATSCIILARPTQSSTVFIQSVGRGMRNAPGKTDCLLLDITDNVLKHRLQPLTLGKVLERPLQDGESVLEADVREQEEREKGAARSAREEQERKARVTRRAMDLRLHLLAPMHWRQRASGAYWLEVGTDEKKHTITLIPSEEKENCYTVRAALSPDYQWQTWMENAPLDLAQQHAEVKAKLLEAKKEHLADANAPWRINPASLKQLHYLYQFGIAHAPDITSGEASDLIGKDKAERARRKNEEKLAKLQQSEATPKRRGRRTRA